MDRLHIHRRLEHKRIMLWVPLLLLFVATGCISNRYRSVASLKRINDNDNDVPLYVMRYHGDHESVDLQTGRGLKGLWKWLYEKRTNQRAGLPQAAPSAIEIAGLGHQQGVNAYLCTCFSAMDQNSDRLFGRNLDWSCDAALLLFTDPSNGYASVSMVDLTYFGVDSHKPGWLKRYSLLGAPYLPFDGMNECGVAVGIMTVPHADGGHDPNKETLGLMRLIREILNHASTVEQATAIAEKYNITFTYGPPAHLQVSDVHGDSAIIEFVDGETTITQKELPWQVCTNFIVSGKTEKESLDSCWRYNKAHTLLGQSQGYLSETSAMELLDDVSEDDTAWSIVYEQSSGKIQIVAGQDYEQVYEFQLGMRDKPDSETIIRPIPPLKATKPKPRQGAGQVPYRKPILKWKAGQHAQSHRVYFGTDRHSLRYLGNVTSPEYTGLPELHKDVTYYWRVDEVHEDESIVKGDLWRFEIGWAELADATYEGLKPGEYMSRWLVLGPIPVFKDRPRDTNPKTEKAAFENDTLTSFENFEPSVLIGQVPYQWKIFQSDNEIMDLDRAWKEREHMICYAWAQVNMPQETEALLGIGSDDAVKVWLNGELVHENWVDRGVEPDDDVVPVTFRKGHNQLILKVQNGTWGWGYVCRLLEGGTERE